MSKKKKQIKAFAVSNNKQIKTNQISSKQINQNQNKISFDKMNFNWKFSEKYLDLTHNSYGWDKINTTALFKTAIFGLERFEQMTWEEVKKRKHSHPLDMIYLKNNHKGLYAYAINKGIEILFQVDVAQKERVIGYKIQDMFFPIWYDKAHTIYPA